MLKLMLKHNIKMLKNKDQSLLSLYEKYTFILTYTCSLLFYQIFSSV